MGDDADVLRFRPRGLFEEDIDDGDGYEYRLSGPYDDVDR